MHIALIVSKDFALGICKWFVSVLFFLVPYLELSWFLTKCDGISLSGRSNQVATYTTLGMWDGWKEKLTFDTCNGLIGLASLLLLAVSAGQFFGIPRHRSKVTRQAADVVMRTGDSLIGSMRQSCDVRTEIAQFGWGLLGLALARLSYGIVFVVFIVGNYFHLSLWP